MSKRHGVQFRWKCIHCERRNITLWNAIFEMPQTYSGEYQCQHCGCMVWLIIELAVKIIKKKL